VYRTVLYCSVPYCTVLYCTILYRSVLYCNILYRTVLYCNILYRNVLHFNILYRTVLYCTALYYIVPYCTVLGTAVAQCLRCCATNRIVGGSIPAGVSGFFIDIKFFRSHYGPGVDSVSNINKYQEYFLGVKAAGA